ncbi:glycoside hydrolase family 6 protein [Nonomuraea deserti]|nr:glycoside hydrolase family 6 protein [Nonomuraea deserti]
MTMEALRDGDPRQVGPYTLLGRLGEGGMGVVYLGRSPDGTQVAVKLIHARLDAHADFRRRFAREVAAAKRVARFCTAPVLDADVQGDLAYLVTEYVEGPSLGDVVRSSGPLKGSALDGLAASMAMALRAIHGAGVVHRDLKPSNVLLSQVGPKVIDFGIAQLADAEVSSAIVGTPSYMSPEQVSGATIGPPSDIFSWGCTVAFAAGGVPPFGSGSVPTVLLRIVNETPDLRGLTGTLRDLVVASLVKNPAKRPTAQDLMDRLSTSAVPGSGASRPGPSTTGHGTPVPGGGSAGAPAYPGEGSGAAGGGPGGADAGTAGGSGSGAAGVSRSGGGEELPGAGSGDGRPTAPGGTAGPTDPSIRAGESTPIGHNTPVGPAAPGSSRNPGTPGGPESAGGPGGPGGPGSRDGSGGSGSHSGPGRVGGQSGPEGTGGGEPHARGRGVSRLAAAGGQRRLMAAAAAVVVAVAGVSAALMWRDRGASDTRTGYGATPTAGQNGTTPPGTAGRSGTTGQDATQPANATGNPLVAQGKVSFYSPPEPGASKQATLWEKDRPEDAELMSRLAAVPQAIRLNQPEVRSKVDDTIRAAEQAGGVPVFLINYMPGSDCLPVEPKDMAAYQEWIRGVARQIGQARAVVILEPSSLVKLPGTEKCDADGSPEQRYRDLRQAVRSLKSSPRTAVYLDGSQNYWPGTDVMARRLIGAGIEEADGFFVNTAGYQRTEGSVEYGKALSACVSVQLETGGEECPQDAPMDRARMPHFVIDTARNGQGSWRPEKKKYKDVQVWCNPPGRGVGPRPTTETGEELVDAYLWVARAGESSGRCRRGTSGEKDPERGIVSPEAGQWWADLALERAKNANPPLE